MIPGRTRSRTPTTVVPPPTLRVAVYCRQSVLSHQEFGSIQAQREAVEAYILSQRAEGWVALPDHYDDGGFSGATTERPAFQRLVADVEAGKIDILATYRIDRVSRSLADFTGFMELLDRHGVGFVSTTQSFDTRTSMGRLTLNILASFSQFERESISERTRDKMSASRRRGMWTGGRPVLGYDLRDRRLVVNPDEAERVRAIFRLYLETGSLIATAAELERRGWANKTWTTRKATIARGSRFTKTTLSGLLRNPLYLGRTRLGEETFAGAHEPIVDVATFETVQQMLREHRRDGGREVRNRWGALLKGLVRCGVCGSAMAHTFSYKRGRTYRYYVCLRLQNEGAAACPGSRVSAGAIEGLVVERVRAIGGDPAVVQATVEAAAAARAQRTPELVAEQRTLRADRQRLEAERTNLLAAVGGGGPAVASLTTRLAEVDDRLAAIRARDQAVAAELAVIATGEVDREALARALAEFGPLWDQLVVGERCRLLRLVLETVTYDARTDELGLRFRSAGIRVLAREAGRSA
ncbi:MAG: recombinase family protein [Planctomycetes bacterium]|nr:recombinase family protein [Planctomycetota bacterium]